MNKGKLFCVCAGMPTGLMVSLSDTPPHHPPEGQASRNVGYLYRFCNFGETALDGYIKALIKPS